MIGLIIVTDVGILIPVKGKGGVLTYIIETVNSFNLPLTAVKVGIPQIIIRFIIVADVGIILSVQSQGGVPTHISQLALKSLRAEDVEPGHREQHRRRLQDGRVVVDQQDSCGGLGVRLSHWT